MNDAKDHVLPELCDKIIIAYHRKQKNGREFIYLVSQSISTINQQRFLFHRS